MNSADEEAYRHFKDTLFTELTQNIKPIILSLTMLAEDYRENGHVIAQSIDEYIRKVQPDCKILGLYLMDSIMKNIKQRTNYIHLFEKNIINLFSFVFESVNESNRKALYKLRQTWTELFTNTDTLFDLDVTVKKIDPAWPITAVKANKPANNQNQMSRPEIPGAKTTLPNRNLNNNTSSIIIKNSSNNNNASLSQTNNQNSLQDVSMPLNKSSSPTTTTTISNNSLLVSSKSSVSNINQEVKQKQQVTNTNTTSPTSQNDLINKKQPAINNNPTNRDPRLLKGMQKQQHSQPPIQTTSVNISRPVGAKQPSKSPTSSLSPPTKRIPGTAAPHDLTNNNNKLQLTPTQQPSQQPSNGLKRSSPSSCATPTSNEIKKPKMSNQTNNGSSINKVSDVGDSPLKPNKQFLNTNNKQQLDGKIKQQNNNNNNNNNQTSNNKIKMQQKADSDLNRQQNQKISSVASGNIQQGQQQLQQQRTKPSLVKQLKLIDQDGNEASIKSNKESLKVATNNEADAENINNKKSNVNNNSIQPSKKKIPSLFELTVEPVPKVVNKPNFANNKSAKLTNPSDTKKKVNISHRKEPVEVKENNVNYANDVDERFKLDDMNKQIASFDNLIKENHKMLVLNETNESRSETMQVDSTSLTNTSTTKELETNSHSLNELKQQLEASQKNDLASADTTTSISSNTQNILEMIQTLLVKQKQLIKIRENESSPKSTTNSNLMCEEQSPQASSQATSTFNNMIESEQSSEFLHTHNNKDKSISENSTEHQQLQQSGNREMDHQPYYNDEMAYADLPPIRPRDKNENQSDSLLIIDGRSYRIQPDVRRLIKIYYHDHELFCDTRTKDVYVDTKRVYKMSDPTKEIALNGRRVRFMYMGKRVELWIDGVSFHFRADSPPKQVSINSATSSQLKRYYVTIDSRTMDMYFNNWKVCQINGGAHGPGPNVINARLAPDDFEQHEISFVCPPKRIMIDGVPRKMRYDLAVPCIEMDNGQFYIIRFEGPPKEIFIDDSPYLVHMDKTLRIKLNSRSHELTWGGPGFEVIIDGRPYEIQFNKPPREIIIGTRPHLIYIGGDAPEVKICGRMPEELLKESESSAADVKRETDEMRFNNTNGNYNNKFHKPPPLMSKPAKVPANLNPLANLNPFELMKKLTEAGILKQVGGVESAKKEETVEEKIPDLTSLDNELLKQKYNGAIQKLYSGVQCAQCGNRFNQQNDTTGMVGQAKGTTSRYSKHLDWHFRQNKKEKEEVNKAHSRSWYYTLSDWLLYEELSEESVTNMDVDAVNSNATSGKNRNKKSKSKLADNYNDQEDDNESMDSVDENGISLEDKIANNNLNKLDENDHQSIMNSCINSYTNMNGTKSCPATNDVGDSCHICNDPFDIFYYEEKEEWHFKDAVRVENRLYHPICLEDANNDANNTTNNINSSVPSTPSAGTSSFNPSNAFELNRHNVSFNSSINNNFSTVKDEPIET